MLTMNCTKDLVSRKCSTSIVRGRVSRAKESLRERERATLKPGSLAKI